MERQHVPHLQSYGDKGKEFAGRGELDAPVDLLPQRQAVVSALVVFKGDALYPVEHDVLALRIAYISTWAHQDGVSHTMLKVRLVKVQLASGEMKGMTEKRVFRSTIMKRVVAQAPINRGHG